MRANLGVGGNPKGMAPYAIRRAAALWRPELGDFDGFVALALARAYDAWFLATHPGAAALVNLKTEEHARVLATQHWGGPEEVLATVPAGPAEAFAEEYPVGTRVRTDVDAALERAGWLEC